MDDESIMEALLLRLFENLLRLFVAVKGAQTNPIERSTIIVSCFLNNHVSRFDGAYQPSLVLVAVVDKQQSGRKFDP